MGRVVESSEKVREGTVVTTSAPQHRPPPSAVTRHDRVTSQEAWRAARAQMTKHGIDWPVAIWLGVIHLGALAAPWFFSWSGLVLMVVFHWLTGGVGVCLGYHRLLTHGSFKTPRTLRYVLALIGGWSGEGSALQWVANHRKHHAHSDHPGDPHSPLDGPWWSHLLWTMCRHTPAEIEALYRRWIPDLREDRGLILLDRLFLASHFALGLSMCLAGYIAGGWPLAVSWVVWGMFLRLALVLHSTWFVNSASHIWGYRNYDTTDESRNNWWVALLTYGEGWHNNHHAYPRMARHGHRWWEVDVTFWTIRLLQRLGWAWDVVDHQHQQRAMESSIRGPREAAEWDTAAILQAHGPELAERYGAASASAPRSASAAGGGCATKR